MSTLAMLGGPRAVPRDVGETGWPVITRADEEAVLRVLRGGVLTATAPGEPEVAGLEEEWARYVGAAHCAAVGSGTAALQLALAALGVGPGDEVVVPAVSMNATALAVAQQGATPVFADIDPRTFCLDPAAAAAVTGPRTAALLPVHLHGLPADMAELGRLAARRGLAVVEDAAQAHGARYRGTRTGALGDAGCFSLHPSKNLPTCGEGGLVTTSSADVDRAVRRLRTFGERLDQERTRSYVAHAVGWNHKLSPVQAAMARVQLAAMDDHARRREAGIRELLDRLGRLPGLRPPHVPSDRTHVWHILRVRIVPEELGIDGVPAGAVRRALHRVLRAEGVPVSRYQEVPLPDQPAFTAKGTGGDAARDPASFPVARAVLDDSLCLQRRHLNPGSAPALRAYADGFAKVWEHLDVVGRMARSLASSRGGAA
ncbi:dTDP-4-amino-4,6-dideoxygalactose transaminase [Streptosporangium becharense]|uniref:dTDP-4-amino-4,6-dideoxygalactose transaminase n=1 Tax=Streptosporangium becharense TaxID=1816182 RepID=A0A7W9ILW3_9ACTN|nr:DegT/DnrJ/EryC1/StrS family aminotransferase [Streptosporangium becharense]MBB2910412.1 dTDP-4-amino-4,6-dideoxygalactose transaminase [Streptosporangium becharense]MBB5823155.1 dTDP-4-amino-4,6-dideoxygalactose transaminase [Streptosporangium becharense]